MRDTISFKLKKAIFGFIGDIKWAGLLHPFWFVINATTFRLKGKHYREVEPIIKPGDIVIRRFEGYLDKWLIPGWWNHAGIYVGNIDGKDHKVVHAISDGVVVDDLIDFMRTDHLVVLRAPEGDAYGPITTSPLIREALARAKGAIGKDYDFAFEFDSSLRFSCTELICHCYKNDQWVIQGKKRFGRYTVVADDIVNSSHLKVVWTSTGPPPMPE